MVTVKNAEEIATMRKAGMILADVLDLVEEHAKPGVSTKKLDTLAYEYIIKQNAVPSFLGYNGFPATLCTSIDDEVVHGIPSAKRILEEGMLLKIDGGAGLNGFHTDAARTIAVGRVSPEKEKLMRVCKESFFEGIRVLKAGVRLGTLGNAIQRYAESNGFSVIRELCGHGIGTTVHEDPEVLNYGIPFRGMRVSENMTLAIEPMINLGKRYVYTAEDDWTIRTEDGAPSAHYENTVAITAEGVEILTLRGNYAAG